MSSAYSENYTTHLRAHSKILNGERTESPLKSKYVRLIKQFPEKKKSSSWSQKKFKQRRLNSKSSASKPNYNFNPKIKKKTKSKKRLENSQKKQKKENECLNNEEVNINANYWSIKNNDINNNNYITKSTDCFKNYLNSNYFKKNNESNELFNKALQNDNLNKNDKINKTINGKDCFENYFDIFKLRKHASSLRDKIRNNYFNFNFNSNLKNQKTSTYFKAMKLKEEIQNSSKNINKHYTSHSSNRMLNNEKNLLNEMKNKSNNNINISKGNKNGNQNKNIYNNTYDDHTMENISYHIFDKSLKMPKKKKKYFGNSNPKINNIEKVKNNKNFSNQQFKNQNKKNTFRKKTNNSTDNNNQTFNNNINIFTNSAIFSKSNKNEIPKYKKNFDYMNLINPGNLKLNALLQKIPSSRFKEKSLDLMNNIFKLQSHNIKNDIVYNIDDYNNSFHTIYPVNEYDPLIKIKNSFK